MQYRYKTNINCLGCVSQIKPHLDKLEQTKEIEHWKVDLQDPNHILTIYTSSMSDEQVRSTISAAGFRAEQI